MGNNENRMRGETKRMNVEIEVSEACDKTFMVKANRDRFWRNLSKEAKTKLRRTSMRNQLLHPMYVDDYPRALSKEETGFGNTLYRTYFSAIYLIEKKYW